MPRRTPQNNETTRRPFREEVHTEDSTVTLLTVLSHPDLRRIGERAALTEFDYTAAVELGRHSPRFSPLGSPWNDRPLDDPYLSRKSWKIASVDHGLELIRGDSSTDLRLEGEAVEEAVFVSEESLERGVTLELSSRIALLLHRIPHSSFVAAETEAPKGEMIGAAQGIMKVRSAIDRVADLDVPVLIRGESGTGKELVARALHRQSRRASKPFVAVDLGVLSPSLAAAELFGHAKGAFTGAHTARQGFFRVAEGGTLFLDEVGEATAEVQAMLLRVLESRQVVPVGSHEPISVDVRLIAATDSDLVARTRRGDFKEPLLHRLAAYIVDLPPLRERREDIGRLFVHLARPVLRELGEEDRLDRPAGDGPPWLPADLMARLAREMWTGNVRQLANVVRQVVIDSRDGGRLRQSLQLGSRPDLDAPGQPNTTVKSTVKNTEERPTETSASPAPPEDPVHRPPSERTDEPVSGETLEDRVYRPPSELTEEEVEEAMWACDFEPTAAARRLGIGRPSFYKLVRQHPNLRLASDIPEEEVATVLAEVEGNVADAAFRLAVSKRALSRRLTQLGLQEGDERAP